MFTFNACIVYHTRTPILYTCISKRVLCILRKNNRLSNTQRMCLLDMIAMIALAYMRSKKKKSRKQCCQSPNDVKHVPHTCTQHTTHSGMNIVWKDNLILVFRSNSMWTMGTHTFALELGLMGFVRADIMCMCIALNTKIASHLIRKDGHSSI